MELVGQPVWAPGRMAVVEGSLEVGNPDLAVDNLDPGVDIHILLVVHLAAGSLDLEVLVGREAGRPVYFVHSSHRRAHDHREPHRLGPHHMMVEERLEAHLLEYLPESFQGSVSTFASCLPAGFLSSSSSNSFIFFLRKSILSSYCSANAGGDSSKAQWTE